MVYAYLRKRKQMAFVFGHLHVRYIKVEEVEDE